MPPEPKSKIRRKSSKREVEDFKFDGLHIREIELKRSRGEISCAECRRLKIKCNKTIPCQSCIRRGCGTLCPNGSLSTGQGTRFVLAATEHLHRKITRLSNRVRLLEDALAHVHGSEGDEPHPLLQEELLSGNIDDRTEEDEGSQIPTPVPPGILDAFGTLSISENGISRFFGPTGGSESLLMGSPSKNLSEDRLSPQATTPESSTGSTTSVDGYLFSRSFPFTPMGNFDDVHEMICEKLPDYERATLLSRTYFEELSWLFRGLTEQQLCREMLPAIYQKRQEDYGGPHDLALLFTVFSLGVLVQDNGSPAEAEHFHQVSRAALGLQPVLEKPSIVTIQTLHLMSIYNSMNGLDSSGDTSMEMTWSLVTMAAHLGQNIGLHRDSEHWGLPSVMIQRRRLLFWDLFVADTWQSLNTGRPPSFSLDYVDCQYPQYSGSDVKEGTIFELWQFRFASECVADVVSRTLTPEAPSYATIMELDRKIREFPLPEAMGGKTDQANSFQRFVIEHIKETVLMYIHRSFFAQAIIEEPSNPLKSVYAPSFLASFRAATTILKSVREQFNMWPNSCPRYWATWTFAFTAAVVFGTVVTRGPKSPLAASALTELEKACVLFSKAAIQSRRAAKALPILTTLLEKARYSHASAQTDSAAKHEAQHVGKMNDVDDELRILAGHTRFVTSTSGVSSNKRISPPPILERRHTVLAIPSLETESAWSREPIQEGFVPLSPVSMDGGSSQYPLSYDNHQTQSDSYSWVRSQQAPVHAPVVHDRQHVYDQYSRQQQLSHHRPSPYPQHLHRHQHHPVYSTHAPPTPVNQFYPEPDVMLRPSPANENALADLGLIPRDSRLDARWSTFMHNSGVFDGYGHHGM